ncbi:MAG TPA: hypothetical protein VFQ45_16950 [Longimicrobium sp.]|nr:hypothetical protein [Longimicrobium sp.]
MFATHSLADARRQLDHAISLRLLEEPAVARLKRLCVPVGFLFIRGDRAGQGGELAEQVVASYGYWNDDAGRYLDMVFPGWGKDGDGAPVFDRRAFLSMRNEMEAMSAWTYSGETDALLLDYVYELPYGPGAPSFENCIQLPVEALIRAGGTPHMDAFMHELVVAARETWPRDDNSAIRVLSDRLGAPRLGRSLRDVFLDKPVVKDLAKVYGGLRDFAVRDLRG